MGTSANVIIGPASMTVDATDVGFTKDGIAIRFPREYVDVMADQIVGTIKKGKSQEQMFVKTTLLETTDANLYLAWDQTSGSLGSGFTNTVNEKQLVVTGSAPGGGTRTFTLERCVSTGESELMMSREEEMKLEVEWEVLKNNSGQFGTIT